MEALVREVAETNQAEREGSTSWLLARVGVDALQRARRRLQAKAILIVTTVIVGYGLVILGHDSALPITAGLAMLAVGTYGSIAALMHDANHGATFDSERLNHALGHWVELFGASAYWWRHKHNGVHHVHPNIGDIDPDVQQHPFLRLNPHQPWRWWYRLQHLYAPVLYGFMMLHVAGSDGISLAQLRNTSSRLRMHDTAVAVAGKALFLLWGWVVPFMVFGWRGLVGSFALSWAVGLALALTVQVAHAVDIVDHFAADGRDSDVAHQGSATADVHSGRGPGAWLFRFLAGGLDRQVAHHLAPSLPHTLYRELQPHIEELFTHHGVTYRYHRSIPAALGSHFRWLRELGKRPTN